MTGNELATRVLKLLGILAPGETATANDAVDVFDCLNDMLDAWGAEKLTIYFVQRQTPFTLTAATDSYTIGTGGSINVVRPVWIENAGLIIDNSQATLTEMSIRVFTNDEWARVRQKSLQSSLAQGIWYDYNWSAGLGRIYVYPVPSNGLTQLVLYRPVALVQFADQATTDYTFPPGYAEALRYNVALRYATEAGRQIDPAIVTIASESLARIKRANIRPMTMDVDRALLGSTTGAYDWRTDTVVSR